MRFLYGIVLPADAPEVKGTDASFFLKELGKVAIIVKTGEFGYLTEGRIGGYDQVDRFIEPIGNEILMQ